MATFYAAFAFVTLPSNEYDDETNEWDGAGMTKANHSQHFVLVKEEWESDTGFNAKIRLGIFVVFIFFLKDGY
jgi:hypothetical protein